MKTDPSGLPDVSAHTSVSPGVTPRVQRGVFRRVVIAAAIGAVLALVLFAARHAVVGGVIIRGITIVTGDRITIGAFRIGRTGALFSDIHMTTAGGDPLLDVERVRLRYRVGDLRSPGSGPFELDTLVVEHPVLAIVRHADGSYNLRAARQSGATSPSEAARRLWNVRVHIADGTVRLIDRAPVTPDLSEQRIVHIMFDGQLRAATVSRATGRAQLIGRESASASLRSYPIDIHATADAARGVALVQLVAARLPVRGPLGYVEHSSAVRIDDGALQRVQITLYGLGLEPGLPRQWHLGGRGDAIAGRLRITSLVRPVRELRGRLTLVDDGVWSKRLDAELGGLPLVARGGVFNRLHPTLRLALRAQGDLRQLRRVFAFSRNAPVAGDVHVETLLEAPIANLLIRSTMHVDRGSYGRVPLRDVDGRIDYHAGAVVLDGVRGRYGSAAIGVGARFILGSSEPNAAIVATASAPGGTIPFAENLAPESMLDATTLITSSAAGYRARGAIGVHAAGLTGAGFFSLDERGVGEFGPIALTRSDGSSVVGALRLERPTSQSAAWISARRYRVAVPATAARLAGLNLPAFPPVAGVIDGQVIGAGRPDHFALAGNLTGADLRVGDARLGQGHTMIGGALGDVRLDRLIFTGPLGHFTGSGAAATGGFALRGGYTGSLERLVPLTGDQAAHGALRGDVLATIAGSNVVVQSGNAVLSHGTIHGVALDSAAGTIAVQARQFRLIAATGSIMGRRAVAAQADPRGTIALSAPDIPSAALRGTGVPLDAGNISAYGLADLHDGLPRYTGALVVAGGVARGLAVAGDAQIDLAGAQARFSGATGALGSTFGSLAGTIAGIGGRQLRYDLAARIPLGDLDPLRRDLRLPVRHLAGTFNADLHIHGSGTRPIVDGRVAAPEGMYNGLAFRTLGARVVIDPFGAVARDGSLTIGSTTAAVDASVGNGVFGLNAHARRANLADFNDFFDVDDTFAGQGALALSLRTYGGRITTSGLLAMQGLRYRTYLIGAADARWHMNGQTIVGHANVASPAGTLGMTAAIGLGGGVDPLAALRTAHYDMAAQVAHFDLGTWLPAAGLSYPVLGTVDARLRLTGEVPRLAIATDGTLSNGTIGAIEVPHAHLRAHAQGSRITVDESDADLGFASLVASGQLGVAARDSEAFDLRISSGNVGRALRTLVPAAKGLNVAGNLDADVHIGGTRARPQIAGGFDLQAARYANFTLPRAIGSVAFAGKVIELRDVDVTLPHGQAFVAGSVPLVLRPFGLGPDHAPIAIDVTARDVELAQFDPLLPAGTSVAGMLNGRFGIEGSLDRPHLFGSLGLASGSYVSAFERAPIDHVNAQLNFADRTIALQTFHADVGGGRLDGSGRVSLPIADGAHLRYRADLTASAARLDFPAYGRGTIDANLDVSGTNGSALISGDVSLRDAVIPVSAIYGRTAPLAGADGGQAVVDPALRIHAVAADNVRVRSAIVDIGVTGAVDLSGRLTGPKLDGGFSATDGTISSYNHVFRIVNAAVGFTPADGITPTIEARAISRVTNPDPDPSRNIAGSATITVTVTGTADDNNLAVTYSSDPAYSQEQIIGLLLDVPALLGAVNFNLNGGPSGPGLRGAPGESNALLPPGVTPQQVSAISLHQEAFSLLNGQVTQRALTPVERVFEKTLGLSDAELTVDYGGGIGYSLRRQIGKRDFYAFLSQTVTYPARSNLGFELEPRPYETINFSYYEQNGVTSLITNQTPGEQIFSSTGRLTSIQPLGDRSGFSLNYNRRF